jgi:ketosteroid isomerase-like protein
MSEEPPSVVTRAYESLSRRDLDAWLETTTPDVELHEVAAVPDSRVYRGHRQVREWAEAMLELVVEWRWTPEETLLRNGDTAVVRCTVTGRSQAEVPIDLEVFHVFQTRGDKVSSMQGFFDRASALQAAGSEVAD